MVFVNTLNRQSGSKQSDCILNAYMGGLGSYVPTRAAAGCRG